MKNNSTYAKYFFSKKLNSYVMIEKFKNYMQKGKFLLNYNFLFEKKTEKNIIHVIIFKNN
jgi:hypothetical protein